MDGTKEHGAILYGQEMSNTACPDQKDEWLNMGVEAMRSACQYGRLFSLATFGSLMNRPITYLSVAAVVIALAGCADMSAVGGQSIQSVTMPHIYKVMVADVAGKPLSGVKVSGEVTGLYNQDRQPVNCVTDDAGTCPDIDYAASRDLKYKFSSSYLSTVKLKAKKESYYDGSATAESAYGSSYDKGGSIKSVKITLEKPTDYLQDSFANSTTDKELRNHVLAFLAYFQAQGALTDSTVMLKGIGPVEFKGKKYLQIKLNSDNVYNTLKLNNYAIGAMLFDGVVRKMIDPLNGAVAASKTNFGYDITVIGHSKDFLEKYAISKNLTYRFLIPETVARRYKNKDISGQELLNSSVVLLDDERIDLKLQ